MQTRNDDYERLQFSFLLYTVMGLVIGS